MKRNLSVFFVLFTLTGFLSAQDILTLDAALAEGSHEISGKFPSGTKVVVLNMTSESENMSDYLIEEITAYLVNDGTLDVLDRKNLQLVQDEMQFQLSGEVSDDSAQAIGKKLGAQSIISGTFDFIGDRYRFRVRVIEVETAKIQLLKTYNVASDKTTAALMGNGAVPAAAAAAELAPSAAAPAPAAQPAAAAPVKTQAPAAPAMTGREYRREHPISIGLNFVASGYNQTFEAGGYDSTVGTWERSDTYSEALTGFTVSFDLRYLRIDLGSSSFDGYDEDLFYSDNSGEDSTVETLDIVGEYFDFGLYLKLPFAAGPLDFYPIMGIEYKTNTSLTDSEGNDLTESMSDTAIEGLDELWLKLGAGLGISFGRHFYIQGELMIGFKPNSDYEDEVVDLFENDYGADYAEYMTIKADLALGLGWRF